MSKIKTFHEQARRRVISPKPGKDESGAKQSFKDEVDINRILARYQVDGALNHFRNFEPEYGDFTGCEFTEAMYVVGRAKTIFEELPSRVRQKFQNPGEFFDWIKDPGNREEAESLGFRQSAGDLPELTIPAGELRDHRKKEIVDSEAPQAVSQDSGTESSPPSEGT